MKKQFTNFRRRTVLLFCTAFITVSAAVAQPILRLPAIIGDHMVLQADTTVKIWGWADPRAKVYVAPQWTADTLRVQAGGDTKWEVELTTPAKGGPYSITVGTAKLQTVINDVMIGQVWLCGGQSNMNWSARHGVKDMQEELKKEMNPQIRLFTVTRISSEYPQEDCVGKWEVCTPESAEWFSAVGYFFGKHLAAGIESPVGLINSSWGGSPVETWTPADWFDGRPDLVEQWKKLPKSQGWDINIGTTYNAMIYPIERTAIAGAVWYQGEANTYNAETYAQAFGLLINSWRGKFGRDFPFYYVQIAPYRKYAEGRGILVREQQAEITGSIPGTGMIVVSDLVDNINDIHPRYKEQVGVRLANYALAETYGKNIEDYISPSFRSIAIKGGKAEISFNNAKNGLYCRDEDISDLEICGADGVYRKASGKINPRRNTLTVWSAEVREPVAVRYAFSNDAQGNLTNKAGLPVAPFRTDRSR